MQRDHVRADPSAGRGPPPPPTRPSWQRAEKFARRTSGDPGQSGLSPNCTFPQHGRNPPTTGGPGSRGRGRGGAKGSPFCPLSKKTGHAIKGVIAVGTQAGHSLAPYAAPPTRTALKGPTQVFPVLKAPTPPRSRKPPPGSRPMEQTWYWVCFGGIIFFLITIPLTTRPMEPPNARGTRRKARGEGHSRTGQASYLSRHAASTGSADSE